MEFRLIYQGLLPAESSGSTRREEKHLIRRQFHGQLRQLWSEHPALRQWCSAPVAERGGRTTADAWADSYARSGFRFLPLITRHLGLACSLDILFLRRDSPGNLIKSGAGDIDNRIKVLFDALRMPTEAQELTGESPSDDENPFYCLLEDDSLITKFE